jgi:hypothetical protein
MYEYIPGPVLLPSCSGAKILLAREIFLLSAALIQFNI